jgi:hypothetical protein
MNKKRLIILLVISILATLTLSACSIGETIDGSGNVVEEDRTVSDVSGVNLATIGKLTIEIGDSESLRIEAEDNLLEHLETEVNDGMLRIGTRGSVTLDNSKPINYYLTVTSLEEIQISSAGDIDAPDLESEDFAINIDSSGNLEMGDLTAETLNVNISSSGDVKMGALNTDMIEVDIKSSGNLDIASGKVKSQNISSNSSGDYNAQDLESIEAEISLNSSGSATIWVLDDLKANLNSSGDLNYRGDPTVDQSTNSSGKVTQIQE